MGPAIGGGGTLVSSKGYWPCAGNVMQEKMAIGRGRGGVNSYPFLFCHAIPFPFLPLTFVPIVFLSRDGGEGVSHAPYSYTPR